MDLYDCNHIFELVLILLSFHFILLMYLTFVFYILEDGHMVAKMRSSSLCI
jgi:hypothetical protein